jgi:two-component system chemotaxis sensor kinase CheA
MALDLAQFHDAFFDESFEALDTMEAALLKLNVGAPDAETVNTIFRVAHSIKGGSATFGFAEVASFTHTCETILDELRANRMEVTRYITDLLLKSVDIMREMLRAVQHKTPIDAQRVADVQFDLELAIAQKSAPSVAAVLAAVVPAESTATQNAYRWRIHFRPYPQLFVHGNDPLRMLRELADLGDLKVAVAARNLPTLREIDPESCYLAWDLTVDTDATREVIDQVFDWAEGDCELKIHDENAVVASVPTPVLPKVVTEAPEATRQGLGDGTSIRVSTEKIDELMNTVGELVITQSMLTQLGTKMTGGSADQLRAGLAQLERNVRELQESVMRVRMLPISFVFSRFPRMVRDLSQRLGKQVELKMIGDQTELDKTVLEKIGDPLVHLVRNSVDHGIEMPQARVAAGKPACGIISLEAYHKGGNIVVEVCDDGGGLQRERILAKARERGLVAANEELSDDQIFHLIFMPGFSTNDMATDISGRGVGMDVVRRNIKELVGGIEVSSTAGRGSRFVITLPLTLAIVDGQSVSVGSETYIVPLITIIESLQLKPGGVNRIAGHQEVFWFRDGYVPIVRLHEVFGVRSHATELHEGLIMVVEGDGRRAGLFVDDLLGQQQVVIKSLETNFRRVDGVSGATILGDGAVALILVVPGLIRAESVRAAA